MRQKLKAINAAEQNRSGLRDSLASQTIMGRRSALVRLVSLLLFMKYHCMLAGGNLNSLLQSSGRNTNASVSVAYRPSPLPVHHSE